MKIWVHLNGQQQGPYEFDQLKNLPITPQTPVWYDGLVQWTVAGVAPATAILFQPDSEAPTVPPQAAPQQPAPQQPAAQPAPQAAPAQPAAQPQAAQAAAQPQAAPQPAPAQPQAAPQQPQWQQPQWQQPQWQQPQWQQPQWQQPQWQQPQWQQPQWQQPQSQPQLPRPSTYLVWSVLLMIFCCSPFALVGMIFGIMSSSRYDAGDFGGAKSMSNAAAWMLIISIATALFTLPIGFGMFTGCGI